jgi:hypothetical protein
VADKQDPQVDKASAPAPEKKRVWLPVTVFLLVILMALMLHRCQEESPPPSSTLPPPPVATGTRPEPVPVPAETLVVPPVKPPVRPKPADTTAQAALPRVVAPVDSGPYIYADPWGGRHFDSVRVSLHCREGCLILYSFEDSVHFKSYEEPFVFRRNTTLWLSGIDSLNRQVAPIRVEYVIERNPGACAGNSMPLEVKGKTVCMDIYEWPNREGEIPRTFVNQKEAADSCRGAGKRLCSQEEWRDGCQGPDGAAYPYGGKYNENHCPAKEPAAARAGRFPVCRSYYGVFDMTGNLWEWTSTPAKGDADFFIVAGGNWDAGNEATCSLAKYSFYPSVRYPFVGFRCCSDVAGK